MSFATAITRCDRDLSEHGKVRLKGSLRHAADPDNGLGPLNYEMAIATNLWGEGYDVSFHDLETDSGFDLLASKEGASVQIECKHISGDRGRKIHLKDFYALIDRVEDQMLAHLRKLNVGLFLRLTLGDRLEPGEARQKELSSLLRRAVVSGSPIMEENDNRVEITEFNVAEVTDDWAPKNKLNAVNVLRGLKELFGINNSNAVVYLQRGKAAIVLAIESRKPDRVLQSISELLRESSKKQLDGSKPGIICCHLSELSKQQLDNLYTADTQKFGLRDIAIQLFKKRPNLHSVVYSAQSIIDDSPAYSGDGTQREVRPRNPARVIKNEDHPRFEDERLNILGGS